MDAAFGREMKLTEIMNGRLVLNRNTLGEGDYILDAVITPPDGQAYDCLSHFIEFSVDSPSKYGDGLIAMENAWELNK